LDVANGTKDSPRSPAEVASIAADQALYTTAARTGAAEHRAEDAGLEAAELSEAAGLLSGGEILDGSTTARI
jgi:hypothetical protein